MKTFEIFGAFVNCTDNDVASHVERLAEQCKIALIEGRTYTAEVRQVWAERYDGKMVSLGSELAIRDEYTKTENTFM